MYTLIVNKSANSLSSRVGVKCSYYDPSDETTQANLDRLSKSFVLAIV